MRLYALLFLIACLMGTKHRASASQRHYARDLSGIQQAVRQSAPGDEILLLPNIYRSGMEIDGLRGTADQPIIIRSALSERPATILGGIRLRRCSYVKLIALQLEQADQAAITLEGFPHPCKEIIVSHSVLSLSPGRVGILAKNTESVTIQQCYFKQGAGATAVDLRAISKAKILECQGETGEFGKGIVLDVGCQQIEVLHNRFRGSYSPLIRIIQGDKIHNGRSDVIKSQLTQILIANNWITRPATCIQVEAPCVLDCAHNVIYQPQGYIFSFNIGPHHEESSLEGVWRNNILVWRDEELSDWIEPGETWPESLRLQKNVWFCQDVPGRAPSCLRPDSNQFINVNPLLHDEAAGDYRLLSSWEQMERQERRQRQSIWRKMSKIMIMPIPVHPSWIVILVSSWLIVSLWSVKREDLHADFQVARLTGTKLIVAMLVLMGLFIYGSLLPFHYRWIEIDEAFHRFRRLPYLQIGAENYADWMANLLLFVPIAWCGASAAMLLTHGWLSRLLAIGTVVAACQAVSLGVEFLQLFFPPRTVSQNDIQAQGVGTILGMIAACITQRWWSWVLVPAISRVGTRSEPRLSQALFIYTWLITLYLWVPFDIVWSRELWGQKIAEGRITWWVVSGFQSNSELANQLLHVLLCLPVGLYWGVSVTKGLRAKLIAGAIHAGVCEAGQLLVFSRRASVDGWLFTWLGEVLGIIVWQMYPCIDQLFTRQKTLLRSTIMAISLILTSGFMILILSRPDQWTQNRAVWCQQLSSFWQIPFAGLYRGEDFTAFSDITKKIAVFCPLGFIIGDWTLGTRLRQQVIWKTSLGFVVLGITAVAGELLQARLITATLDVTTSICYLIGGLLGYQIRLWLQTRADEGEVIESARRGFWWGTVCALAVGGGVAWLTIHWAEQAICS